MNMEKLGCVHWHLLIKSLMSPSILRGTMSLSKSTSISTDREAMLERVADMMEKDLILVGATAVEDKLQKGVHDIIVLET